MSDQITNKLPFNNVPYFSGINRSSHEHFLSLLNSASNEIIFFGLTCGFYLSKPIKKIIIQKSQQIPIKILILHPQSIHRKSHYELEPAEAKYHNVNYFKESVIEQYRNLKAQCEKLGNSQLEVYLYDFMPVFGLELIDDTKERMVAKVKEALGNLKGKTIAVLGLSFKPNTDDMREAPSLKIISSLQREGAKIRAYDPKAMEVARKIFKKIEYGKDPYDVAKGSDALLIITEWNQFRNLDLKRLRKMMKRPVFLDFRNIYEPAKMREMGFKYFAVGR